MTWQLSPTFCGYHIRLFCGKQVKPSFVIPLLYDTMMCEKSCVSKQLEEE